MAFSLPPISIPSCVESPASFPAHPVSRIEYTNRPRRACGDLLGFICLRYGFNIPKAGDIFFPFKAKTVLTAAGQPCLRPADMLHTLCRVLKIGLPSCCDRFASFTTTALRRLSPRGFAQAVPQLISFCKRGKAKATCRETVQHAPF